MGFITSLLPFALRRKAYNTAGVKDESTQPNQEILREFTQEIHSYQQC